MPEVPDALEGLLDAGDVQGVIALLAGLEETERKSLRPAVKAFGARIRSGEFNRWEGTQTFAHGLARIGTEPGAAGTSTAILAVCRDFWRADVPALVGQVVGDRQPTWAADLLDRVAGRLGDRGWITTAAAVEAIRVACDLPRPRHREYLRWLAHDAAEWDNKHTPQRYLADPELLDLFPEILASGLGGRTFAEADWETMATSLIAAGAVDRESLLDRILDAYAESADATHVKSANAMVTALAPTEDDVRARLRLFLGLLDQGSSSTAALVIGLLRTVDRATPLEPATVAEAVTSVLLRPEKGSALKALDWLAVVGARGSAPELLAAARVGLGHDKGEVADKARTILVGFGAATDESAAAAVVAPDDGPAAVLLPPLAEVPPRIRNLAELAEVAAHLSQSYVVDDPLTGERFLAAVAELVPPDPAAAREALNRVGFAPVHPQLRSLRGIDDHPRGRFRGPRPDFSGPAGRTPYEQRCDEISSNRTTPRILLATPALRTGHVDPDRVVHLLRSYADEGIPAAVGDLEQAWYRLPRGVDLHASLTAIGSPDALTLRDRLDVGLPEPEVLEGRTRWDVQDRGPLSVMLGRARELEAHEHHPEGWAPPPDPHLWLDTPSHREVVALQLLPRMAGPTSIHKLPAHFAAPVAMLGRLEGPAGTSTGNALLLAVTNATSHVRLAAVDALLGLADLDADTAQAWGLSWGAALAHADVKAGRLAAGLSEVHRAGASVLAARIGTGIVAGALASAVARQPGMPDLMSATADAARSSGMRAVVPGLAELAGQGGSSQLVKQAGRLAEALGQ